MNGQSKVTPEMLSQPVSEASLGDFVSALDSYFELKGIGGPVSRGSRVVIPVSYPPSPCDLATQAAFMVATTLDAETKQLWQEIYNAADVLCSRSGGHSYGGRGGTAGSP
jgi:hypothetical protein